MSDPTPLPSAYPVRLESPSGLSVEVNANGSIRRMDHRDILLNLFPGNEVEGGPVNLYLRRHGASIDAVPLLGPCSPSCLTFGATGVRAQGKWHGVRYTVSLVLAQSAPAWFWHLSLENAGNEPETLDLVYTQDLSLAHYGMVRLNEYYVSQYLDHTPLSHPAQGVVLATRQNLSMGGRNPWCLIGALSRGVAFATDALQFHGLSTRAGVTPPALREGLPGARRQHEHAMAALQDAPLRLAPGESSRRGFFGWFEPDHSAATIPADVAVVERALSLPEAVAPEPEAFEGGISAVASLFSAAPRLDARDLSDAGVAEVFGGAMREAEREGGRLLSFFAGTCEHVVLKAKELQVLRPHGQILRTGGGWTPDESSLTTTTWMAGVFHSMLTQGHVSINRFLSTTHSYLGLFRSHGQRLFVERDDGWQLLDVPSAYAMAPDECRWIYQHAGGRIEVRSGAPADRNELSLSVELSSGGPLRFLVSHHVALNGDDGSETQPVRWTQDEAGVFVRPVPDSDMGRRFPAGGFRIAPAPGTVIERVGGDELLFADGRSRSQPYLCLVTAPATSLGLRLTASLIPPADMPVEEGAPPYWRAATAGLRITPPAESPFAADAARLAEILPWYAQNALIHYLAPRGLEQYSGGGWGVRDVCQGPVEMLLALGRFEPLRDLLLRVFKTQNPDGDWPQWFMFFDRERNIRPGDSHGDIVFWPVLVLAQYLYATEDAAILEESAPFFHSEGDERAEWATVWEHVERALAAIQGRVIPGTRLAAYGHGDWNDSLQPANPAMRERLCSAWTVTLHYQTLTALSRALDRLGRSQRAMALKNQAAEVLEEFQRLLIRDGVLTGFAYFHEDGPIDFLLHPDDRATGLSYSLLPMVHAVGNDLLTPEQATAHLQLIETRLTGPDGARLFDRPMAYRGGPQTYFQRAESSTFFGREIGLMYTHAHLRYAEALARYGDAEAFFRALCKANPIAIRSRVPAATLRQSNCYYSSSDAAFADRYQAFEEYERVKQGEIPLDGGWRVYSSGAGIAMGLVFRCFLGLQQGASQLVVDPVIPRSLDGLRVELELAGRVVEVTYYIAAAGCGPTAVRLNGAELPYTRGANPYRTGAAEIPLAAIRDRLTDGVNRLTIHLA